VHIKIKNDVYTYTHTHKYTQKQSDIHADTPIEAHTHARVRVCAHSLSHPHAHAPTHTPPRTLPHTYSTNKHLTNVYIFRNTLQYTATRCNTILHSHWFTYVHSIYMFRECTHSQVLNLQARTNLSKHQPSTPNTPTSKKQHFLPKQSKLKKIEEENRHRVGDSNA